MRILVPLLILLAGGATVLTPVLHGEDGEPPEVRSSSNRPFLGITVDTERDPQELVGLVVRHVYDASTAAELGILGGDVITALNGEEVRSMDHLRAAIAKTPVGEAIAVTLKRGEEVRELEGTMRGLPSPGRQAGNIRDLRQQIEELRDRRAALAEGDDDVDLASAMQNLADALNALPAQMQAASERFKEVYPDGRFAIRIEIDIRSDVTADENEEVDLSPNQLGGEGGEGDAEKSEDAEQGD